MGCHALLQGILPTQGSNPRLLPCGQILYPLNHQGDLRAHLGPERIPAEGLRCSVFEVPRGQRDYHFSKKHPPGEHAQVPHGHLQLPAGQPGQLHLVLRRRAETVSLGSQLPDDF